MIYSQAHPLGMSSIRHWAGNKKQKGICNLWATHSVTCFPNVWSTSGLGKKDANFTKAAKGKSFVEYLYTLENNQRRRASSVKTGGHGNLSVCCWLNRRQHGRWHIKTNTDHFIAILSQELNIHWRRGGSRKPEWSCLWVMHANSCRDSGDSLSWESSCFLQGQKRLQGSEGV